MGVIGRLPNPPISSRRRIIDCMHAADLSRRLVVIHSEVVGSGHLDSVERSRLTRIFAMHISIVPIGLHLGLLGDLAMQVVLLRVLGVAGISWGKAWSFHVVLAATNHSILLVWIWSSKPVLFWSIVLINFPIVLLHLLVSVVSTVDSSLTVLTHWNKLLIGVSMASIRRWNILLQQLLLVLLIDVHVSNVSVVFFVAGFDAVSWILTTYVITSRLHINVIFFRIVTISPVSIHQKSVLVLPATLEDLLCSGNEHVSVTDVVVLMEVVFGLGPMQHAQHSLMIL